jgi:hypothetical protein
LFVVWESAFFTVGALIVVVMAILQYGWRGRIAAGLFLAMMIGIDSCEVRVLQRDTKAWDRADHCGVAISKWGTRTICLP